MNEIKLWWAEFKIRFGGWWERNICGPDKWGED